MNKIVTHGTDVTQTSSLTKELEKNRIKLNHLLQEQKPLAPKVSPIIAPKVASTHHQDKAKVETKSNRGIKRRSILDKENEGCQVASKTPTRNKRTVNKDEAVDEVPVAPASAAKRPRRSARDSTAATTVAASVPADKMKNGQEQENQDIKLTMTRSKKISARSSVRASILDKDMMDNPFAKKATRSTSTKRPLETITNKT